MRGHLDPQIGWCGSWSRLIEAVEAFRARTVRGKTVLTVE